MLTSKNGIRSDLVRLITGWFDGKGHTYLLMLSGCFRKFFPRSAIEQPARTLLRYATPLFKEKRDLLVSASIPNLPNPARIRSQIKLFYYYSNRYLFSPSFSTRGVGGPGNRSRTTSWSKGLHYKSYARLFSSNFPAHPVCMALKMADEVTTNDCSHKSRAGK